jgi:protein tyrosine/serine phosphatase
MAKQEVPFRNSYWVVPGRFLAGEYPGSSDERMLEYNVQRLLALHVDVVIDLTDEGEGVPYAPVLMQEAQLLDRVVEHRRFPILDFFVPSVEEMAEILDAIDAALAANKIVYLHCMGGIGRTGTVVGCYLVRHGLRGDQALETLANLRRDVPTWYQQSPETSTQRELVFNWQIGA